MKKHIQSFSSDRERLFQILSIFLDNAVCYSPEDSSIQIQTASGERELTFSIVDHGKGILQPAGYWIPVF